MKKICLLFSLLFISVIAFSQSIFIEIKGVPGETPDGTPVLAYSWGASNSGNIGVGGGMGSGKANIQDISFTMQSSKISMEILKSVAAGTHFAEVKFKIIDNNKKLLYLITLEQVLATSYQQGTSCGNNNCDGPVENASLTFAKFRIEDFRNKTQYGGNIAQNQY